MQLADETQARSDASRWDVAFNTGDIEGLAGFYAEGALVIPAGGTAVSGQDAIGAFFADLKSKGFAAHKITVEKVLDQGATQVATGKWQLDGPTDDGTTKQYGGNWVNVLVRAGDDWRILLHTWN
jgi:ketosteroid isomerase-like protein